jgi:hypothetical protein
MADAKRRRVLIDMTSLNTGHALATPVGLMRTSCVRTRSVSTAISGLCWQSDGVARSSSMDRTNHYSGCGHATWMAEAPGVAGNPASHTIPPPRRELNGRLRAARARRRFARYTATGSIAPPATRRALARMGAASVVSMFVCMRNAITASRSRGLTRAPGWPRCRPAPRHPGRSSWSSAPRSTTVVRSRAHPGPARLCLPAARRARSDVLPGRGSHRETTAVAVPRADWV